MAAFTLTLRTEVQMNRGIALSAAILLAAGCGREATAPATSRLPDAPVLSQAGLGASVDADLARLRRVTAAAHDTLAAAAAGWSAQITGCMSLPGTGAMGFHYGNPAYIGDGILRVDQPEILLYEPTRNGGRKLVGVEYVVLYSDWPREAAPPVLFGREFVQVDVFGLWGLHAWTWAENPLGMFEPWNPRVSCEFAAGALGSSRHH